MVVPDNFAAYELGGCCCNFSIVDHFCRFCNCTNDKLIEKVDIDSLF